MMNQTQLVRSAVNLLIVIAVFVSVFQQLTNTSSNKPAAPPTVTTPDGQTVPLQPTGPKIPGIRIQSTDRYHSQVKEILAKNKLNVEIVSYEFQGNQYWINMVFNWGHIVLIYFLMSKYKMETNDATKRKIMIGGAIAVMAWFYFSAQMKPQKFAIEVHGSKVYEKDYLLESEVVDILSEYQFEADDLKQSTTETFAGTQKIDAWEEQQKRAEPKVAVVEEQIQEQIF